MVIQTLLFKGYRELTMKEYEALDTLETEKDYNITDYPINSITNSQMEYALTCLRLFQAGETFVCSDNGTYIEGHTYTITESGGVKSWSDITPITSPQTLTNTTVSSWVADNTYADFGYKADITVNGITTNDLAEVIFGQDEASSGNYANVTNTSNNTITIYSRVNNEITIPTIVITKGETI